MRKGFLSIFFIILLFQQVFPQYNPVRVRFPASTYSAQLRGISGTRTSGLTVQGVYSSNLGAHVFQVATSGPYNLWFDAAGGSNYSIDSQWSKTYGVMLLGWPDAENAIDFVAKVDPDGNDSLNASFIEDSTFTLSKLTTAAYNFIASGGSVTNNPDDITLENKGGSTLGIKDNYLGTQLQFKDTTTLKAASFDSVGFVVNLKQLSSGNTAGGGQFVLKASGTPDKYNVFTSPGGRYWVRVTVPNTVQYGLASFNKISTFASSSGGKVDLLSQSYTISDSFNISGKSVIIDGGSRTGTKIKQSTGKDIFRTTGSHIHSIFRNMWLQGTGKQDSSKAIYQTNIGAGADLFIDDVRIDSFGVAVGGYDATNVWLSRSFLQYNKVGLGVGYQGDGWLTTATKFYDSDTAIYLHHATNTNTVAPVTAIQPIFGRDTVEVYVKKEADVYNQLGGYSEDSHTLYLTRDIAGASVGNTANFIGNYSQGAKVAGFEIQNPGRFTFIGNLINTGNLNDDFAVDLVNAGSATGLVMINNLFTGGQDSVRFQTNHHEDANRFIVANRRLRLWHNGTPLASSGDPVFGMKVTNVTNKEVFGVRRLNDGDAAEQYAVTIEDISASPVIALSKGGVRIGENASLPAASATYKGMIWHNADKFHICVDDGVGGYEWQQVSTVAASDTVWHGFYSRLWYKENAAGFGDVTDTTWTDGYDRTGIYFPDGSLTAIQIHLTPTKTIASSASLFLDFYWRAASATTGNVVLGGQYAAQGEGAAVSFSTAATTTDAAAGTATNITRTRITMTTTGAVSTRDILIIRPRRVGADASDTMTDKAILQYIRVGYL